MDDDEWTPPTEAEMKVIQAKRERADKISSLMGSYLLKGYKMLNETCPNCTTIYLRDKQDELYCVACVEVDADTEKDNPASSAEAARRQVAESQFASPGPVRRRPTPPRPAALNCPAGEPAPAPVPAYAVATSTSAVGAEEEAAFVTATAAVRAKLSWAASQLESSASVESSVQLVGLIRACADTLHVLRQPAASQGAPFV